MVWGLFPVDPLPGETGYYIFQKGVYQVGRKGCDIIVDKDKGVSRVHAEIIVEDLVSVEQSAQRQSNNSSKVRIRDCSKYGTSITTVMGSHRKVHELPNKETVLADGDLIKFGTGAARFKFSFVPLIFFTLLSKSSTVNKLREKVSLMGASVTHTWSSQCTHVICDDVLTFSDAILDAILARKELVKGSWIEAMTGQRISSELPNTILHTPNLIFEGISHSAAQPQSRDKCLEGYTFILESIEKYKLKEKFPLLLELASAKVYATSEEHSSKDNLVFVIPENDTYRAETYSRLAKVKETELIMAVISGHLDQSVIASVHEVATTSSGSSDETVVAESDVEMETATSMKTSKPTFAEDEVEIVHEKTILIGESTDDISRDNLLVRKTKPEIQGNLRAAVTTTTKPDKLLQDGAEGDFIILKNKAVASECPDPDVIFSQGLIVSHQSRNSATDDSPVNFKRFRKTTTPSGNSFTNLIPFSKHPYQENDYASNDIAEAYKEERKRKQMEAVSDELFNNDKVKRKTTGSILRFLSPA